jgi:hypothetical protein
VIIEDLSIVVRNYVQAGEGCEGGGGQAEKRINGVKGQDFFFHFGFKYYLVYVSE